jgi:hypothetical protein
MGITQGEIMSNNHHPQPIKEDTSPKSTERITRWRLLFNWQEEKKTEWLQTMASQGWLLEKIRPFHYIFRRGEPADMVYRLDYIRLYGKKWQEYLALFRDAGWEYVGSFARWKYFRKLTRPGESQEIYSDAVGQIEKYKRFTRVIWAVFIITIINLMQTFHPNNPGRLVLFGPFRLIHFFYFICLLLLGYSLWQGFVHIRRMRQDIRGKL